GRVGGPEQVVGCSAAGVLAGDLEVEGGPAVAALVLQGDLASRRFFVPLERGRPERVADSIADAVGDQAKPGAVLLLFADSYNVEGEPLLPGPAGRLPGAPGR